MTFSKLFSRSFSSVWDLNLSLLIEKKTKQKNYSYNTSKLKKYTQKKKEFPFNNTNILLIVHIYTLRYMVGKYKNI